MQLLPANCNNRRKKRSSDMSESIKRNYIDPNKTMWVDPDGTLHLDAVRCCEALGVPPTQANQDMVEEQARRMAEQCRAYCRSVDDLL